MTRGVKQVRDLARFGWLVLVLVVLAGCAHGPADDGAVSEPTLVDGSDPEVLLKMARALGEAELSTDSHGDPSIIGRVVETRYRILFHGCDGDGGCSSVMFATAWAVEGDHTDLVMNWNQGKRFGRASLDSDLDPVLEMDVNLEHGVTVDNMRKNFEIWKMLVTAFRLELMMSGVGGAV